MNKRGFTLAELLIVVAIIAVLVVISIPIFQGQLEKAREATDAANIRSEYAKLMSDVIAEDYNAKEYKVSLSQQYNGWQNTFVFPATEVGTPKKGGSATLTFENNIVYINYGDGGNVNPSNNPIINKAKDYIASSDKVTTVQGTLYKYKGEYYIATKDGNMDKNEEPSDNHKGLFKVNVNTVYNVSDIRDDSVLASLKNVKKGDVLYDEKTKTYYVYYGTNDTVKADNQLQKIN